MSTYTDLLSYYSGLLIAQYANKPKAVQTIQTLVSGILMPDGQGSTLPLDVLNGFNLNPTRQTLVFSAVPTTGSFTLGYGGSTSAVIQATATGDNVLAAVNGLLGPKTATVSGNPSSQSIVLSFQTVPAPLILTVPSNTLQDAHGSSVSVTVQTNLAIGQQLDWLGKYVGVARSGVGANGQSISLGDQDFYTLIRIAIASRSLDSALASIDAYLNTFFPGEILVFDYADTAPMQMSYLISTNAVNENVIQLALAQGLLPSPMGVSVSVVGAPVVNQFVSWSDYFVNLGAQPANSEPLNSIAGYTLAQTNTGFLWMDYSYSLVA